LTGVWSPSLCYSPQAPAAFFYIILRWRQTAPLQRDVSDTKV
jgi:hypothetical protein